jgi:hypothetical protein
MVEPAYNPSYAGDKDETIIVLGQPGQKTLVRPHLNKRVKYDDSHL